MPAVIRFQSSLFDADSEPVNPINPIRGAALLAWLRTRLPADVETTAPEAEDWGWYIDATWQGRRYLVGAGANDDDGATEWMLQLDATRSWKDRLLGRGKLPSDDGLLALLLGIVRGEPAFTGVQLEAER